MPNQICEKATATDFRQQIVALLPRMRNYALALTRDRHRADDLVHDTVVKALAAQSMFTLGTNLAAWLFRIERNTFISGLRRTRMTVPFDQAIADSLSLHPQQESGLVMREFLSAFSRLSLAQREALLLSVIEGQSYQEIAEHTGVTVGTVKSRVSRARDRLELLMLEGRPPAGRTLDEVPSQAPRQSDMSNRIWRNLDVPNGSTSGGARPRHA